MIKQIALTTLMILSTNNQNEQKLIDSIVIHANDTCEKYYNVKLFKPHLSSLTRCKYGVRIHGSNLLRKADSTHWIAFDAIKANEWDEWRIRLKLITS